jgi:hypothetical protein
LFAPVIVQTLESALSKVSKPRYWAAGPTADRSKLPASVPPRISVLVVDALCEPPSTTPLMTDVPFSCKVLPFGPN